MPCAPSSSPPRPRNGDSGEPGQREAGSGQAVRTLCRSLRGSDRSGEFGLFVAHPRLNEPTPSRNTTNLTVNLSPFSYRLPTFVQRDDGGETRAYLGRRLDRKWFVWEGVDGKRNTFEGCVVDDVRYMRNCGRKGDIRLRRTVMRGRGRCGCPCVC